MFIGGLLGKKNENIRRFSTEVLMYILKKIRNKEELRGKFNAVFMMEFRQEFNNEEIVQEEELIEEEDDDDEIVNEIEEEEVDDDGKEEDVKEEEENKTAINQFWSYEDIIEDFRACMLYEFLKGHAGAFSTQVKDVIDIILDLLAIKTEIFTSFIKSLNMFLDWEFTFFHNYRRNPANKPNGVY